jgi:RNA ligase (TIGR02306 family)
MYKATVLKIKNVRPHPNADRVQLATCHGNQVVVGLETQEGDLGVYFPTDGVLSHEFCYYNNLYRTPDMNVDTSAKPGMFDDNRRVRAQKFRGEISDGYWTPLGCFDFIEKELNKTLCTFEEGLDLDELVGTPICQKYVNRRTLAAAKQNQGKKSRTAKTSVMFKEHFDTEHFGKYLHEFKKEELIVITEKLHGTSGRVAHVLIDRELSWKEKIAKFFGVKIKGQDWGYLNGTRRVVLEETSGTQYHDPTIREIAFNKFKDNLRKGETAYFEIVGYESSGLPVMPPVETSKLSDKSFSSKYGSVITYSYGCAEKTCEIYVYRITITNEDGQSVDLCWNDVKSRCDEMGVKYVPELGTTSMDKLWDQNRTGDERDVQQELFDLVDYLAKGDSLLDQRHIKEGVCVRIDQYGLRPKVYKHKSFEFKVLEGIAKDSGIVDSEEAQG